jgi:hypothetical protein
MIIRHGEKPEEGNPDPGLDPDGKSDPRSLTARGWQRAKALAGFFYDPSARHIARPGYVFAAKPNDESQRPLQTVTPLATRLWPPAGVSPAFDASHDQDDFPGLVGDVMAKTGTVLISWEHKRIPVIVEHLPDPPTVPPKWPGERFDLVWVLDGSGDGWTFHKVDQHLLSGDK